MNIETERLLLTPLGPQYLQSTHIYASDLENTNYMMNLPNKDINETRAFLDWVQTEWSKDNPEFYEFAITLDKEHIGAVSVHLIENGSGELGWILNKKYFGNGYAIEAAKGLMNFAIMELKIKNFIAHCDSENVGSYRVMEKLGMTLVDKTPGRRNRSSNEDREELVYTLEQL